MGERTLVVSAGHTLSRGHQAVAAGRTSSLGEPVHALYGVTQALLRVLDGKRPSRAVGIIGPLPAELTQVLGSQLGRLDAILTAHGITSLEMEDEAQGVAMYVHAALALGDDVVVLGSDKRYAQLVSERVWWYDAFKSARYTPEMVKKRFLVGPDQVADWLALVGDEDALPGLKGIGKKGATRLLERHRSVEAAVGDLESLDTRTRNALSASLDELPTALARARLAPVEPPPVELSSLLFSEPSLSALNQVYGELGFYELLASDDDSPEVSVVTDPAEAREIIATFEGCLVAIQVLSEDPSPPRGAPVGLAACAEPDRQYYFPFVSGGSGFVIPAELKRWLEAPDRPKTGHDTGLSTVALARVGIALKGVVSDTTCLSHLTEPSNWAPHDLSVVARQVVQKTLPGEDDVRGVGQKRKAWASMAVQTVAAYAGRSTALALEIQNALAPRVDAALVREYLELSGTVSRMSLRGLAVDTDELKRVQADFLNTEGKLEEEIFRLAGRSFNLGSPKQLGSVLFEDLGLTILSRTKTGWSTATPALERIQHEHPIVSQVIHWRALQRMRNTWITALSPCIDDDGRVRSTFYPARSFSGRIVNANPDLGRVPGRTEEMQRIRRAFVAPEGAVLLSLDYRQLGLFVLAHLTEDPALVQPLAAKADMHRLTAAAVLDIPLASVDKEQRQLGKVVNFATFAGQGASALALQLSISAKEAKTMIARFDERYSVVRAFQDEQLRLAKERGYIETISGRRWPIGGLAALDPQDRSYAERLARRATHEGSVADISRRGLVRAEAALRKAGLRTAPLLQVHDEVLFECPKAEVEEAASLAAAAMADAYRLKVPLSVGRKAGPNWADLVPV